MKTIHSPKFMGTALFGLTNNTQHLYKYRTQHCATNLLNYFLESSLFIGTMAVNTDCLVLRKHGTWCCSLIQIQSSPQACHNY